MKKSGLSGRDLEDLFFGKHDTLHFEINVNSSFEACFVNAVMAQPKGHDPDEPTDKWLVIIKEKLCRMLGSPVSLYNCRDLPIDILHSTDLLVVSWPLKSFVTVDITLDEKGSSKADTKFLFEDFRSAGMDRFCQKVADFLRANPDRIGPDILELMSKSPLQRCNSG